MKLTIISGSHRKNSESLRAAHYLHERISHLAQEQNILNLESHILDLSNNPLPLWDEEVWSPQKTKWNQLWTPYSEKLKNADCFIVITPEWGGMVPPGLKNLFLLCSQNELADKPALIVSISSSFGGAYPVHELKTSSYKNTHLTYIPNHIILRNCTQLLKESIPQTEQDIYIRKRIDHSLNILICYSNAFKEIRKNGGIDRSQFPYGM